MRSAVLACAILLSGCLGAPAGDLDASPSASVDAQAKPLSMYIVATDSGSPFSEGIYKLRPATFEATKGDVLNVTIKNAVGNLNNHDLVIPDLSVRLPSVPAGESASLIVNATKTGTFAYYCSIGNHRALGMEGRLTIS